MRITIISPTANLGGGLRVILIHAAQLRLKGHEVNVFAVPERPFTGREVLRSLVRDRKWPRSNDCVFPASYGGEAALRMIESHRPINDDDVPDADVVIATFWMTAEWVAAMSPSKGVKVYFIQGDEPSFFEPSDRVLRTWHLPMHRIACANWLAALVTQRTGDDAVVAVPNAVDHEQFRAEPRGKQPAPTVGILYSTAAVKCVGVALEVLEKTALVLPGLRIQAFGGEHPQDRLPLPSAATYSRNPPQEQIRDIYSCCDVWLCASRIEGFHLPPLEAMACRCPVVSTRVGGPLDIIRNGVNGYLTDVGDVQALVERTIEVLTLPDNTWRSFSHQAHVTAATYTWTQSANRFEAALIAFAGRVPRKGVRPHPGEGGPQAQESFQVQFAPTRRET